MTNDKFQELVLQQFKELKGDISTMKTDISNMKTDISNMKTDISKLKEGQLKLQEGQVRLEKKLDVVRDQTADLTEFRTETRDKLTHISSDIKEIKNDLCTVQIVAANNMSNIAKLKSVG